MGLRHLQGTSGRIGYYGKSEGKRTRYDCKYYKREAQCCFKDEEIKPCKNPAKCPYFMEVGTISEVNLKEESEKKNQRIREKVDQARQLQSKQSNKIKGNNIKIQSKVKLLNLETHLIMDITLVKPGHANPFEYKVSIDSPLGSVLLNQEKGSVIEIKVNDRVEKYKVLNIK